jgi:ABC-type antimicrobial peptide transport system permease subunit
VRDPATLKAIGMSPRQVTTMIAASAAALAAVGAVLAVPAGIELDWLFLSIPGSTAGGNDIPSAVYGVSAGLELVAPSNPTCRRRSRTPVERR